MRQRSRHDARPGGNWPEIKSARTHSQTTETKHLPCFVHVDKGALAVGDQPLDHDETLNTNRRCIHSCNGPHINCRHRSDTFVRGYRSMRDSIGFPPGKRPLRCKAKPLVKFLAQRCGVESYRRHTIALKV